MHIKPKRFELTAKDKQMKAYKLTIEIEDWYNQYETKEQLEIAFRDLLKINCATLNLSIIYTDITKKRG